MTTEQKSNETTERLQDAERKLKNGGASKLEEIGNGLSAVSAAMLEMKSHMLDMPTRDEISAIIQTHAQTCALARGDNTSFAIGKTGVKASGRVAFWVAVGIVFIVAMLAPYIAQIIAALK